MTQKDNCVLCDENMDQYYIPMKEWHVDGHVCGKCYSKKIAAVYPGRHASALLADL